MAVISMFYGVIVSMYFLDTRRHRMPHIHVRYQEQEAVVALPSGRLLEGALKPAKLKLVQAWLEIHRDELLADWELASKGEQVFKIEPLR
jgi:hypothetical protein